MTKGMRNIFIVMLVFLVGLFALNFFFNKTDLPSFDYPDAEMVQLNAPEAGQEIAIIDTNMGTFKVALYREYAPNTVESFVNLANEGYYDGKYVFSVEKDQFFLAGTTNSNGEIVGEDEENHDTEMTKTDNEIHENLWPLKGSLMSFGPDLKGNGIFFAGINTIEYSDDLIEEMNSQENANMDIVNAFIEKGGNPSYYGNFTVFAQTYEGMDVFEQISNVEVNDSNIKNPKEDVIINSITISTYEG